MTKVAIVNAGGFGAHHADRGSYDSMVESIQLHLERAKDSQDRPSAEVAVVATTTDALKWIWGRGVIVYVTKGMIREARKVAAENPEVKVILLTGSLPVGEIVFVSKALLDHVNPAHVILAE